MECRSRRHWHLKYGKICVTRMDYLPLPLLLPSKYDREPDKVPACIPNSLRHINVLTGFIYPCFILSRFHELMWLLKCAKFVEEISHLDRCLATGVLRQDLVMSGNP